MSTIEKCLNHQKVQAQVLHSEAAVQTQAEPLRHDAWVQAGKECGAESAHGVPLLLQTDAPSDGDVSSAQSAADHLLDLRVDECCGKDVSNAQECI